VLQLGRRASGAEARRRARVKSARCNNYPPSRSASARVTNKEKQNFNASPETAKQIKEM